tara:strand:- start:5259 stop:7667 length:2409 start_codon:yes stop_codon:yes gene_type:complete
MNTAESGGSVGFNNGNIQRLDQSQSNSASFQSAVSGNKKKSPIVSNQGSAKTAQKRTPIKTMKRKGVSPKTVASIRQQAQRAAKIANARTFARAQENAILNAEIKKAKPKTAMTKAIESGQRLRRVIKNISTVTRMQEKKAQRIIGKLNVNNNTKNKLIRELDTVKENDNKLGPFLVKMENARKANQAVKNAEERQKANQAAKNAEERRKGKMAMEIKLNSRIMSAAVRKRFLNRIEGSNNENLEKLLSNINKLPSTKIPNQDGLRAKLLKMKISELTKYAKELKLSGYSKLKKTELIAFILQNVKNKPVTVNAPPLNNPTPQMKITPTKNKPVTVNAPPLNNTKPPMKITTAKKPQNVNTKGGSWEAQMYNILLSKISKQYKSNVNNKREEIIEEIKKINIRRSRNDIITNKNKNISKKQYIDILLLVWLDGIHDGYVTTGFSAWYDIQVNHGIFPKYTFEITKLEGVLGGLLTYLRDHKDAAKQRLYTKIAGSFKTQLVNFGAGWEKNVKEFLIDTYTTSGDISSGNFIDDIVPSDKNEGLLLAVDQQYSSNQERTLTRLINGENVVGLITFGQALDPGSTMLPGLLTDELQSAMGTGQGIMEDLDPRYATSNALVQPVTFKGQSKYALFGYKHVLKIDGKSVFDIELSNKDTSVPKLEFNGKELYLTQSAGKAKKASNDDQVGKISKYFGDALQYILFTHLAKQPTLPSKNRGTTRFMFLGSGDSMALLGYKIFCDIENINPQMIIDGSGSNYPGIHCVHLPPNFKLRTKPRQGTSRAATNVMHQGNNITTAQSKKSRK